MSHTAVIGTVTVTAPRTITNRGFATASWWEEFTVTPGVYDIVATYRRNERTGELVAEPRDYNVTLQGTIVRDFFGSSFGGVGFGSYDGTRNAGKATTMTFHTYGYNAHQVAPHADDVVSWADGITVVAKDHGSYGSERFPDTRRMIFHHAVRNATPVSLVKAYAAA